MKTTVLTIKFMPQWIISNQTSGSAKIVDDIVKLLNEKFNSEGVFVLYKDFQQCKVIIANDSVISEKEIFKILKNAFSLIDEKAGLAIETAEIDKENFKSQLIEKKIKLKQENIEFLKREYDISVEDLNTSSLENENVENGEEEKIQPKSEIQLDDMMSVEPLKKWVNETQLIASRFKNLINEAGVYQNQFFLLSINRGNGLSTILNIMANTLETAGLFRFSGKTKVYELSYPYSNHEEVCYKHLSHLQSSIHNLQYKGSPFRGIVAINIEEWIDHLYDKTFDEFLNLICQLKEDVLFAFTVPYSDEDTLEKIHTKLDDLVNTRVMKFVPPSDKQYYNFFVSCLQRVELSVSEDAYSPFLYKLTMERNDGRFYGFNTVKKIADEVLYQLVMRAATQNEELPSAVTEKELSAIYNEGENDGTSGLEALNGLIALKDVKDKVQEILAMAKLQKEMQENGKAVMKPCYHMMFLGNPGTGKTVVARIIGRIFKEAGLLSVGNFFEVSRQDFIGEYVGHTAIKTMQLCRSAYGSVLFVDEAYLLASDDSYSDEAIGTLIAEMENKRDNMIVIFAGYEKDLENLFSKNSGLKDRVPHKIYFPNYTRDELKQIFFKQFENKIDYDESFVKKADEFFANFPDDVLQLQDFSNGRFVRNLSERIISKSALRIEMSENENEQLYLTSADFELAVIDQDFSRMFVKVRKIKKIGF